MKVFLSSVISGFEAFRDAADDALTTLDHQVIRAEQFAASPKSPQVACLAGVRDADFVVLVLNERYGEPSPTTSPTHQEFLEARGDGKPLFVFVQSNVSPDDKQRALIEDAQGWVSGGFTAGFTTPSDLRKAITRAVNRWQLSEAAGIVDVKEMVQRATAQIPKSERNSYSGDGPTLWVSIVGGPPRQILRPSEIEQPTLANALMRDLSYGQFALFDPSAGTKREFVQHGLRIFQNDRSFAISEDLSTVISIPLKHERGFFTAIVEEQVVAGIERALRFADALLTTYDSNERLSQVVFAVALRDAGSANWLTAAGAEEQERRGRATMRMFDNDDDVALVLRPPNRTRGQLRAEAVKAAEDLMVTLRKRFRN